MAVVAFGHKASGQQLLGAEKRSRLTINHDPVRPSSAAKPMILPYFSAKGQNTSCSNPPRKKERKRVLTGPRRSARKPAKI